MSSEAFEIGRVVEVIVQGDLVMVEEVEVFSTECDEDAGRDIVEWSSGEGFSDTIQSRGYSRHERTPFANPDYLSVA